MTRPTIGDPVHCIQIGHVGEHPAKDDCLLIDAEGRCHHPLAPSAGKYDSLDVWERPDGLRWSVHLAKWVTEASNEFTSWLEDEFTDDTEAGLPEGGTWININEP